MLANALRSGSPRRLELAVFTQPVFFEFTEGDVEYFGYATRQRQTRWIEWKIARKTQVAILTTWTSNWIDCGGRVKEKSASEPYCDWELLNNVQMAGRMRRKAISNIKAGKNVDWPNETESQGGGGCLTNNRT